MFWLLERTHCFLLHPCNRFFSFGLQVCNPMGVGVCFSPFFFAAKPATSVSIEKTSPGRKKKGTSLGHTTRRQQSSYIHGSGQISIQYIISILPKPDLENFGGRFPYWTTILRWLTPRRRLVVMICPVALDILDLPPPSNNNNKGLYPRKF